MYSEVPWEVHGLYLYMMFCLYMFIAMRGRGYGNRFNDYFQVRCSRRPVAWAVHGTHGTACEFGRGWLAPSSLGHDRWICLTRRHVLTSQINACMLAAAFVWAVILFNIFHGSHVKQVGRW